MDATTIGVDLAKTVFRARAGQCGWQIVGRKRLARPQFERFIAIQPATHFVMEACGAAHHWARIARPPPSGAIDEAVLQRVSDNPGA